MILRFMEVVALNRLEWGELDEFEREVERVVEMYIEWEELGQGRY